MYYSNHSKYLKTVNASTNALELSLNLLSLHRVRPVYYVESIGRPIK